MVVIKRRSQQHFDIKDVAPISSNVKEETQSNTKDTLQQVISANKILNPKAVSSSKLFKDPNKSSILCPSRTGQYDLPALKTLLLVHLSTSSSFLYLAKARGPLHCWRTPSAIIAERYLPIYAVCNFFLSLMFNNAIVLRAQKNISLMCMYSVKSIQAHH